MYSLLAAAKQNHLDLNHYVYQIDGSTQFNKEFNLIKTSFMIEHLPANPEAILFLLFNYCMEKAMKEAKENGLTPDRLGITIASRLLNPDACIPMRKIDENTTDAILRQFIIIAQNKSSRASICAEPFMITILIINHDAVPKL